MEGGRREMLPLTRARGTRREGGREGGREGTYRISTLAPSLRKRTISPVVPKERKT